MELVDIPVPVPSPGEVLVETAYASVNFTDICRRSGVYVNSPTYRRQCHMAWASKAAHYLTHEYGLASLRVLG